MTVGRKSVTMMNMNKSKKLLNDFTKYCTKHPGLRFWQALRAWSEADYIIYKTVTEKEEYRDTFYWETKDGK